jgi:O-antigen/teichoic acid export membrane protein
VTRLLSAFHSVSKQHGVLFKNSSALVLGMGVAGVLGFVYWWLAARSFSPQAIGTGSALVSLMGFIGLIGEGGIGTLLIGEIIRHPNERSGLISAGCISSFALSFIIGMVGLGVTKLVADIHPDPAGYLWMLLGCGLTGHFTVVNKAFLGMLRSEFQTLHQFLFSILKLGFVALVALWMTTDTAIVSSWVMGFVVALLLVELFLRRTGQSLIHYPNFKLLYMLRRKVAHHYMLDLSSQAQIIIMPYLVAVLLSPEKNAVFTMVWMLVFLAAIIPGILSTVIFPVIQAAPEQYHNKMTVSLGISIVFAIIFSGFIYLYSSELLTLFNPAYAQIGDSELRFLGFGVIGHAIKSHVGSGARLNNMMRRVSFGFGIAGIFEFICVIIGGHLAGLEGVSVAWATALFISSIGLFVFANPFRQHSRELD